MMNDWFINLLLAQWETAIAVCHLIVPPAMYKPISCSPTSEARLLHLFSLTIPVYPIKVDWGPGIWHIK